MSRTITCPECSETKELRGAETPEGIRITCERCGASWLRDAIPQACVTCGGTELVQRPRALTQYSRGTQLSIVGVGSVLLCPVCDAEMLEWSEGRAVPSNYAPAALVRDAAEKRKRSEGGDVLITP